jgi:Domain of unknown function (DUF6265)
MRMHKITFAAGLLLAGSFASAGESPQDDIDWLSGHWCGSGGSETIEESWLPPRAGRTLGVSRTMRGDRMSAFEFLRIEPVDGVPTYVAQPGGRPPTRFKRSTGGVDWVRFENPAHDFPQRIEYRRDGDHLVVSISGPGEGGKEMTIPFEYRRCAQ